MSRSSASALLQSRGYQAELPSIESLQKDFLSIATGISRTVSPVCSRSEPVARAQGVIRAIKWQSQPLCFYPDPADQSSHRPVRRPPFRYDPKPDLISQSGQHRLAAGRLVVDHDAAGAAAPERCPGNIAQRHQPTVRIAFDVLLPPRCRCLRWMSSMSCSTMRVTL